MFEPVSSLNSEATLNSNIIFIDSQVDNYLDLISGVQEAKVVVLNPENDGIEQITRSLSEYQNISSIQIISHGSEGQLKIGATALNLDTLDEYTEELQQWSKHLDKDADILLMGCKVGTKAEFVERLQEITNADIAASDNLTGYRNLNGDWDLEINLGEIEAELSIDSATLQNYQSILEIPQSELILELDFNSDTGNVAMDSAADGNDNDGKLARNATFTQDDEPFDGVVELSGNDFVSLSSATEINLADRASRTVSVWFNADDINNPTPQIIYQEGGGRRGLNIYLDQGQLYVGGWNNPASQWFGTFLNSNEINSDRWHHVALVLDAQPTSTDIQPDVLFAYLDGVEVGRGEGSQILGNRQRATFGGITGTSRLHTGNVTEINNLGLVGKIDEARIYNRALSSTEIIALADFDLGSTDANRLVAQFNLDETATNFAKDSQKNTRGRLRNGAFFEPIEADLGGGVRFDGEDDFVEIASSSKINANDINKRTISVWFNADNINSPTPQVIYEEGGASRGFNIYLDQGQLYVGGWNRPETGWLGTFLASDNVSSNTWHHVALVLDAPETNTVEPDVLFAYLDGTEVGRGSGSQVWGHEGIGLGGVNNSTRFHRNNVDFKEINGLAGNIASLEVYNQALDLEAIANLADLETSVPVTEPRRFTADNEFFNYDGRIDWTNPQAPALGNPGTSIEFKFTGTKLQIELEEDNWGSENYVDVYLDDNPEPIKIKLRREGGQPVLYDIAEGLENKVHHALIYKRNDYLTGEFNFHSIQINGQLLPPNPDSHRTIEVYGDSISSGTAVEYPFAGVQDPSGSTTSISNAYYSYGSILARDYNAEVSLIAQAGVSLVNGFGYWNNFWNNGTGGEAIYDKVKPLHNAPVWDFNNYSPDLVIMAYGQNDSSTVSNNLSKEAWKGRYKQMIANLRAKHPDSYFVGMFPSLFHNPQWDSYITEAIAEYRLESNDDRVFSLIHEQVTPGHPRISEQTIMADTLREFIDGTLTDNGFNWDVN